MEEKEEEKGRERVRGRVAYSLRQKLANENRNDEWINR